MSNRLILAINLKIPDWQQFVRNKLNGWAEMNLDWAKNFTGDLKIVFYDDLVKHVEESLRDILRFINYDINEVSKLSLTSETYILKVTRYRLC